MQKKEYLKLKKWFASEGNDVLWKTLNKWRGKLNIRNDAFYIFARALFNDDEAQNKIAGNKSLDILFSRVDAEYSELINELRTELSEEQLKSIVLNFSESEHADRFRNDGGFYIQESLRSLVYGLLNIKDEDKLLQAYSGDGDCLVDFIMNFPDNNITGIDISTVNVLRSEIKRLIIDGLKNINILQGRYLETDLNLIDYNKIFSVPPMGAKYEQGDYFVGSKDLKNIYDENNFKRLDDWVNILKIISNPKFEKALFFVQSGILFNERDIDIRKYLLDGGYIEAVIEMPPKLFYGTGISTNIILLSKNNKSIKFIDASELYTKDRLINIIDEKNANKILQAYLKETEISRRVQVSDLEDKNFILVPKRYLGEALDIEEFNYLRDITSIKRGYANLKQSDLQEMIAKEDTHIRLLTAGDIHDDFDAEQLTCLKKIDASEEVYCVKDGDIVFTRGGNYKSLLIRGIKDKTVIVNGTLYIISCDANKVNPYYLQMYLASNHCRSQIDMLNTGTTISFMSIKQLGDIKIPKLEKNVEDEISKQYKTILDKKELIKIQKKNLEKETLQLLSEVL